LTQSNNLTLNDIQKAENELEHLKSSFSIDDISYKTQAIISSLSPGEDLVEYVRERSIDEIIIAIRTKSKVDTLIFGSNAQYVILKADCPVVAVK
jgi:nucleotide-binding universal stress UspA family protein